MKTLKEYIAECEEELSSPQVGDVFAVNFRQECLVESVVTEHVEDGFVIAADDKLLELFESYGVTFENGIHLADAEYQGRKVALGKPMQGDVKKFKVYVKNPSGNVVKVNFGDPNMRIKKSNPKRRKSFRARHNCANPGPRHKARYWSCRKW
jgi:hypothetical protein